RRPCAGEPAAAHVAERAGQAHGSGVGEARARRVRERAAVGREETGDFVAACGKGAGEPRHGVAQATALGQGGELAGREADAQSGLYTSNSSRCPKSARDTTTTPCSETVKRLRSASRSYPIVSPGGMRTPLSMMQRRSRAPRPTSTSGKSTLSST